MASPTLTHEWQDRLHHRHSTKEVHVELTPHLSVAEQMSGFCSKRFVRFLEPFQGLGDRNATRGKNVEVFGWDSSVSAWTVELRGGGGFAGDQRTAFSPVAR